MAPPTTGSGFFAKNKPSDLHTLGGRVRNGGVKAEVWRFLSQMYRLFEAAAGIQVQEFTNPPTADTDAWLAAKAPPSGAAVVYYKPGSKLAVDSGSALDGASAAANLGYGRNVTVTTTGADGQFVFPFTVPVEGIDADGAVVTEDIVVSAASSPGTFAGVKPMVRVTKATLPAGCGAISSTGTVEIGFGAVLGLARTPAARAGLAAPIREIYDGTAVTDGTISATNKSYTPANAPNGAHDYCVYYEADLSIVALKEG